MRYIIDRPALLGLLYFVAVGHFSSGLVQILFAPLILNFATPFTLGYVLSASGIGALFGSILLTIWGGPKEKVKGVLACAFIQGLLLASCGITPNSTLILAVAFLYMFMIPMVRVCRESIWQRKVPPHLQVNHFSVYDLTINREELLPYKE